MAQRWWSGMVGAGCVVALACGAVGEPPARVYQFDGTVTTMAGKPASVVMTLERRGEGVGCRGWAVVKMPGGVKSVELLTGTVDEEKGVVTAHVHESRSGQPNLLPCEYSGVFDTKGMQVESGKKWPQGAMGTSIKWSAKARVVDRAEPDAWARDWMEPATDSQRLMRELTDSYAVGKTYVQHGPWEVELKSLSASKEEGVGEIAKEALAILKVQQTVWSNFDLGPEVAMFWTDILRFAVSQMMEDWRVRQEQRERGEEETGTGMVDSFFDAAEFFGRSDGALNGVATKMKKALEAGPSTQERQNALRKRVMGMVESKAEGKVGEGKVSARLGFGEGRPGVLAGSSPGFLMVKNRTGGALHHATINVDVVADKEAVAVAWERETPVQALFGVIDVAIGVSKELVGNMLELRSLQAQMSGVDTGSLSHVWTWGAGEELEIELGTLHRLAASTKSVRARVVCDEGVIELPELGAEAMRKEIERAVVASQKKAAAKSQRGVKGR